MVLMGHKPPIWWHKWRDGYFLHKGLLDPYGLLCSPPPPLQLPYWVQTVPDLQFSGHQQTGSELSNYRFILCSGDWKTYFLCVCVSSLLSMLDGYMVVLHSHGTGMFLGHALGGACSRAYRSEKVTTESLLVMHFSSTFGKANTKEKLISVKVALNLHIPILL